MIPIDVSVRIVVRVYVEIVVAGTDPVATEGAGQHDVTGIKAGIPDMPGAEIRAGTGNAIDPLAQDANVAGQHELHTDMVETGLPGVLVALLVSLGIGFLNGYLVVRTAIPSFLITLATFFSLRGINLAVTKGITGTVASDNISELDGFASAKAIFASDIPLGFMNIKITVVWWLVFTALASWILLRTRTGNWIFASTFCELVQEYAGRPGREVTPA